MKKYCFYDGRECINDQCMVDRCESLNATRQQKVSWDDYEIELMIKTTNEFIAANNLKKQCECGVYAIPEMMPFGSCVCNRCDLPIQ
jgi:hypothetical protein